MSGSDDRHERNRTSNDEAVAREHLRSRPDPVALPDFAALEAELGRELEKERGLTAELRALSTPRRLSLLLGTFVALALTTYLVRPRLDLAIYPAARMALILCVVGVLVMSSALVALWPLSYRPLPPLLRKLAVALGPLSLLALYSLPAAHTAHPASLQAEGFAALFVRALPCLLIGSGVAASAFLLLRALDRGALSVSLVFAACAGLYANFLLQLHCSVTAPEHMLLGHLGVALLTFVWVGLFDRVSGRAR